MSKEKVCLVVGAGDATVGAVAKRFARGDFSVCVTRSTPDKLQPLLSDMKRAGGVSHGFASNARKEDEVCRSGKLCKGSCNGANAWEGQGKTQRCLHRWVQIFEPGNHIYNAQRLAVGDFISQSIYNHFHLALPC